MCFRRPPANGGASAPGAGYRLGRVDRWRANRRYLRSILARRCLDELIGLNEADRLAVREAIQTELEEILRQAAPKVGAKILKVKLDNLKVDDEVIEQWIENWRTHWYTWSTNQLTEEEAESVKVTEMANAEAQIMPLNLLTKELQELGRARILPRLSPCGSSRPGPGPVGNEMIFAPSAAMDTLKKFQDLLDESDSAKQETGPAQIPRPHRQRSPFAQFASTGRGSGR